KPGGRIVYATCSVLEEENGAQIRAFLARHEGFTIVSPAEVTSTLGERAFLFRRAVRLSEEGLLMTPLRTDTDGFFVAMLRRRECPWPRAPGRHLGRPSPRGGEVDPRLRRGSGEGATIYEYNDGPIPSPHPSPLRGEGVDCGSLEPNAKARARTLPNPP